MSSDSLSNSIHTGLLILKDRVATHDDNVEYMNGICINLLDILRDMHPDCSDSIYFCMENKLQSIWVNWKHYSGCRSCPIEGSLWYHLSDVNTVHRWNKAHKYGALRHDLLDYLIEKTR